MLLRKDGESVIAIPQPSHAWLSGQLARAWGNERFVAPVPNEEVCLAAEQHDIGWLSWEASPVLDERTGLPQEFFALPSRRHIAIWREGVRRASFFGRYWFLFMPKRSTRAISILIRRAPRPRKPCARFSMAAPLSSANDKFSSKRRLYVPASIARYD